MLTLSFTVSIRFIPAENILLMTTQDIILDKLDDTDQSEQIVICIDTSNDESYYSQPTLLEKMVIWIEFSLFEQLYINLEESENDYPRVSFDGQGYWRSMELNMGTAAQ